MVATLQASCRAAVSEILNQDNAPGGVSEAVTQDVLIRWFHFFDPDGDAWNSPPGRVPFGDKDVVLRRCEPVAAGSIPLSEPNSVRAPPEPSSR
jgi:hypothetical protein